jgi:hypothetical protein
MVLAYTANATTMRIRAFLALTKKCSKILILSNQAQGGARHFLTKTWIFQGAGPRIGGFPLPRAEGRVEKRTGGRPPSSIWLGRRRIIAGINSKIRFNRIVGQRLF